MAEQIGFQNTHTGREKNKMLTAIYENGNSVNPPQATIASVEVHQTREGKFECRNGKTTLLGPFTSQETANDKAADLSILFANNGEVDIYLQAIAQGGIR